MGSLTEEELDDLGQAMAEGSDRAADPTVLERARRGFVAGTETKLAERSRARGRLAKVSTAAALAACLAAGFLVWWIRAPHAVDFSVAAPGAPSSPGVVGAWVAASEAPVAVHFSEGSEVTLSPGAGARVAAVRPSGADVLLERGKVHAEITHTGDATRWSLRAGPFDVRVTGTAFDVTWDPMAERFELLMKHGSVVVSGPTLPPGRSIQGGERLVVTVRDGRMELTSASAPSPVVASAAPVVAMVSAAPVAVVEAAPAEKDEAPTPVAATAKAEPLHWKALAASGKHKDALAAVEAAGFEGEVARASAADLMLLADTARFGGNPARAAEALLAARQRFGATGATAFLLGKIAADGRGAGGDARTWFETYLREASNGPLAEQALGRILELDRRDPSAGAATASRYLARYPNGAYSALARSLLPAPAKEPEGPAP